MAKEMDILNAIRLKLEELGCKTFRLNVGKVKTADGRYFDTGLKPGVADIMGVRWDGKAIFIEVKAGKNKPRLEQCNFLLAMLKHNACAGVAYSVEDAIKIVNADEKFNEGTRLALEGVKLIHERKISIK